MALVTPPRATILSRQCLGEPQGPPFCTGCFGFFLGTSACRSHGKPPNRTKRLEGATKWLDKVERKILDWQQQRQKPPTSPVTHPQLPPFCTGTASESQGPQFCTGCFGFFWVPLPAGQTPGRCDHVATQGR